MAADVTGARGYMFRADLDALRWYAQHTPPGDILEVGSFKGLSTSVLATVGPHVTCIDPFLGGEDLPDHDSYAEFEQNMKACGVWDRLTVYRARSGDVLPGLIREYRLVLIDGSHEYPNVLADLARAKDLVVPGGVLLFDDVNWGPDSMGRNLPILDAAVAVFGPPPKWGVVRGTKLGIWVAAP